MNYLIKIIAECGLSQHFYIGCLLAGALCLTICAFYYGNKLGLPNGKICLILLIAYPCMLAFTGLMYALSLYAASKNILGIDSAWLSGAKVFIFLPFMSWLTSKLLKIPLELMSDLLAVVRLIEYPVSSLGCVFAGCCTGYECEFGLYNPVSRTYDFPTQPLNSLIMLIIVAYLLQRAKKNDYIPDGKQMPIMLISMGSTRFLTEFLMDNEKLFVGISIVGFHGIAMCIIGAIMLIQIKKKKVEIKYRK